MNHRRIIRLLVLTTALPVLGFYFSGCADKSISKSEQPVVLQNEMDSINYFLGLNLGYDLAGAPFEANVQLISKGLKEALDSVSPYDQMTSQTVFRQLMTSLAEEEALKAEAEAEANLERGTAFLEQNAQKEGIATTESGLQYEVLTRGEGPTPTESSTVTVQYEGSLIDGSVFESSFETGDTVSFALNSVIPGWTEGVQLMPAGSTYRFFIPPDLAYGSKDQGPIPGNSVLIFKIKLLDFE